MVGRRFTFLSLVVVSISILVRLFWHESGQTTTRRQFHRGRNQSVLFLSNSEHGHANVLLATSHALLIQHGDIEIHYASFPPFEKHVARISDSALLQAPARTPITFHELKGPTFWGALNSQGFFIKDLVHAPGLTGSTPLSDSFPKILAPWNASQYFSLYEQVSQILDDLDPALVVLDLFLGPALDAVKDKNRQFAILSPNTLVDVAKQFQGWGSLFWKYPAPGSGHPFPIPWSLIPANIWSNVRMILSVLTAPDHRKKQNDLRERGLLNPIDLFSMHDPEVVWITQSSPEVDFPLSHVPENIKPCGPISVSTASAEEQDQELAAWLERAPTVLINLGSMFDYDQNNTLAMISAVKLVLEQTEMQVLWKYIRRNHLGSAADFTDDVFSSVSKYLGSRLRVENWINIDPSTMLEGGNIVTSVHHGGSSCYHEAVGNGIPQVVLPMWADCYEFANKVEWLGVGVWGSKASPLNWTKDDLSSAFLRVLANDEEAGSMRAKAKQLQKRLHLNGRSGRLCAADELAKLVTWGYVDSSK